MLDSVARTCLVFLSLVACASAAEIPDHYFSSNGVVLRYVDVGRGDPVVLVHGADVDSDVEFGDTGVIANLASDFRVIALDSRGHGKSGKPHDAASYGLEMVEDVHRLMEHLQIEKAHVVGYSLGAYIAGKFAGLYPERVASVTFGGAAPLIHPEKWKPLSPAQLVEDASLGPPPWMVRNDAQALEAMRPSGLMLASATPEQVAAIRAPILIVVGSRDALKWMVDDFVQARPDARRVVVDGAWHGGPTGTQGRPEFVAAIREHLLANRLARQPAGSAIEAPARSLGD